MKKLLLTALMFALFNLTHAYDPVKVTFVDGIYNYALKEKMERKASELLTEINKAKDAGRKPAFKELLKDDVANDLNDLWDFTPFECLSTNMQAHCITTKSGGYQLRNIQLLMDGDDPKTNGQEANIIFGKNGEITGFHISIKSQQYDNIIKANQKIDDQIRRQQILDYVEQFRTAYELKDMNFMNLVFSDDALIIVGKVIHKKTGDGRRLPDEIEYNSKDKKKYLADLSKAFANNKRIRVTFDEIDVVVNPNNPKLYGVTLKQGYTSDYYHDDGYLFMYWDFTNEDKPEIMVRTWQPEMLNGKKLKKDQVFGMGNF